MTGERSEDSPARVLVLGGGFAGTYAASYLASADAPPGTIEVTLVSDSNFFTFTPLLAEVAAGSLGRDDVIFAHRVLAARRGYDFVEAVAESVDADRRRIGTSAGELEFDYLVVALGAAPRYFGNDELERNSLPFTSVSDAERIRERVIAEVERASFETDPDERRRRLTFAVAGAGPAGVEIAAEIAHLLSSVLPGYYEFGPDWNVVLYQAADRILPGWNDELAATGIDVLEDRGIEINLSSFVQGYDGRRVRAARRDGSESSGDETPPEDVSVDAGTLIWTAGTAPDAESWGGAASGLCTRERSGHLVTDEYLRVKGQKRIFAAGDVAYRLEERRERPYPPVAPIAISQGIRAAGNVENAIAGRPLEPYHAHHAGSILSLGAGDALVDVLGWTMTGRPAWALYRATYLLKLLGTKNKLRAASTLALNRLFERNLTRVGGGG